MSCTDDELLEKQAFVRRLSSIAFEPSGMTILMFNEDFAELYVTHYDFHHNDYCRVRSWSSISECLFSDKSIFSWAADVSLDKQSEYWVKLKQRLPAWVAGLNGVHSMDELRLRAAVFGVHDVLFSNDSVMT